MALKLQVTYTDGRVEEVLVPPKVRVMTERQYEGGLTQAHAIEQVYYMAWLALHRAGKEAAVFEVFLEQIDEVEQPEEAQPEDPTAAAPTPAESSP